VQAIKMNAKEISMAALVAIIGFALAIALLSVFSPYPYSMMGFGTRGMMPGFYGFGFFWLFSWIFTALILAALVLFLIWLIRQLQNNPEEQKRRKK
jgi:uncharacterized membrane protein